MNILSLFDGMSCGQIALKNLGVPITSYYASEIDRPAIRVARHNHPNMIHIGDVTRVMPHNLPRIDLLIGGSPCQGFSFAGKGLNFDDPRSALFFEYVRLMRDLKPKYFLLENVKMKKEIEAEVSRIMGCEPIRINSNLITAQNRQRLYWTNIPWVGDLSDRGKTWGMAREHNVANQSLYYTERGIAWMHRHGTERGKTLKVHGDGEKMQMIEASHFKNYSSQRFFGIIDTPHIERTFEMPQSDVFPSLKPNEALRYISPMECERMQGVADGYTATETKTQRFKMLGNGWTVPVIEELFKGMDH